MKAPIKFSALPATEFALAFGRDLQHRAFRFSRERISGEQSIAFANQQVSNIEGNRDAMLSVKGLFAVTSSVSVLNVVMNEGGLVEGLNSHGDLFEVRGNLRFVGTGHGLIGGNREERTPTFARAHQPFGADFLALRLGRTEDGGQGSWCEPRIDLFAQGGEVEATRAIGAVQVDVIPDPIQVDVRVDAIVL